MPDPISGDMNNNSPWGSGSGGKGSGGKGQSPWGGGQKPTGGRKPSGNRPQPTADLDSVVRELKEKFGGGKRSGGSGGGGKGGKGGNGGAIALPWLIVGAGLIFMAISSVVQVDEQEEAAILRFGEYSRTLGPGIHLKLPTPVETKLVRKTREVQKTDVGGSSSSSLMLTGDENIVDIDFTVLWRISNLEDYLFEIDDPRGAVDAVGQSAMREVVGKRNLQEIITTDRLAVTTAVQELMQSTLDEYKAGIEVQEVQLQKADAPEGAVVQAFRDVVDAAQDKETSINRATAVQNQLVPEARGTAAQIIQDAEAYRGKVISEATGEAERFRLIYLEYKAAPRVTRERMYLETMEDVYAPAEKIVLGSDAGSGVVPYLPLDQLSKGRAK